MRYIYQGHYKDGYGNVVPSGTITVYTEGFAALATCYADTSTATTISGSQITTDSKGYFSFYIDSKDYINTQKFAVRLQKTNYQTVDYPNVRILPDLSGVRDPYVDLRAFLPYGYVTNGSVDYITEIGLAAANAVSTGKRLFIPAGTWGIGSVLRTGAEIFGVSPSKSILYNQGTGDALDLGGASYHNIYENFSVKGNASSRDGITLYTTAGDNPAYMQFNNVYSTYNGRHGLYHRNAWGTKYFNCDFAHNVGLGAYLITLAGDGGTHNGVSFEQSEFRWNGGVATGTTYSDAKGGISINGATVVTLDKCIIESNNAWQVLLGQDTYQTIKNVSIRNSYLEGRPSGSATVGGAFYLGYGSRITIENCEIAFSAGVGDTSYAYFVNGASDVNEKGNNYTAGGGGTTAFINSGQRLGRTIEPVVTIMMGDTGGGGAPVAQTLLTASNDGSYKISGNIYCGRNTETGGVFPFIATRNATARAVTVGASIAGTATTAPTMAWSGNNLQITWGAYHIGHVEFSYSQTSLPTTFTLNSTYLIRGDNLADLPF